MDFLEELHWRKMVQDHTPELDKHLGERPVTGYIGFDPTAPSLTIGNLVQVMLLRLFQLSGHRSIVLMGGATGRIGDPSGKDKERELKTGEELDRNVEAQTKQMRKLLELDDAGKHGLLVNNLDFYKDMNVLDFLRNVGKTLTVNYMMSKESVKKRIETGISFTEFSYQLLQAYDYECLYERFGCTLQMGGSDQWGNITSGTEFIRRHLNQSAHALTTPLLTKADGSKFGKSEQGNVWLDPELTSPYQFYQFWINADDAYLPSLIRYFSLQPRESMEGMLQACENDPQTVKKVLATELTTRIHSAEDAEAVREVSTLLFDKGASEDFLLGLSAKTLAFVHREIPGATLPSGLIAQGISLVDLLTEHSGIFSSKAEAKRSVEGNALSVNRKKETDLQRQIAAAELLSGGHLLVEVGKKSKYMIRFKD